MKKSWKNHLAALFFAGILSACGQNTADNSGTQNATETAPAATAQKIVIGLDDNYPPMGFHDETGAIVGSDIDLAREAAKRLHREVEFKPIDWSSKEAELNSGKIDVIWNGLTITEERKTQMLFTDPYQKSGQVVALKKDSPVQSLDDLKGKVVAIQAGSTAVDSLRQNPELAKSFKEVKEYPDMAAIFMEIKLGRVDGAILDGPVARYYITKDGESFRVLPEQFSVEYDAVGVALGNEALRDELNAVLKQMYEDGASKAIFEKWLGEDISLPIGQEQPAQNETASEPETVASAAETAASEIASDAQPASAP